MGHLQQLNHKIVGLEELEVRIATLKAEGKNIVFTNGCFDILHKGHVTYLALAADFGDVLVLGLNSDNSVRRQGKGADRPVNDFDARATVIAALGFVDFVVEFDEDTPLNLIAHILPDVLVKGGDYDSSETDESKKSYIVGSDLVRQSGGQVRTIDLVNGFSTTGIINKLKK